MSQSQFDLEAFRNFERTSHDKLAESYYDAFSAVTKSAIEPLPERRGPEYLVKFVASEIERWSGQIRASGATMD